MFIFRKGLRLLDNVLVGCGMGALWTVMYLLIAKNYQTTIAISLILKQLLGAVGFGCFAGVLAFLFFEIGRDHVTHAHLFPQLLIRTGCHFLLLFAGFLLTGSQLGWFDLSAGLIVAPLSAFLIIYTFIWLLSYYYARTLARQFNNRLHHL
ncbi:MAG: DUF3021 family protein [Sporolactobacillus sp.]